MRAIIVDPASPHALRLSGGPEPIPASRQVLIDVRHVSVNPAEVRMAAEGTLPPGLVPGWEAAGVVVAAPLASDLPSLATWGGLPGPPTAGGSHLTRDVGTGREIPRTGTDRIPHQRMADRGRDRPDRSHIDPPWSASPTRSAPTQVLARQVAPAQATINGPARTHPMVGDRVVTRGRLGAWASRRTIDIDNVAVVPDDVDLASAVALPVAASTALGALQAAGPTIGRRVLITGASGGVGRFAVQLAALGGAHVIASIGSQSRAGGLRELGADEIVVGLKEVIEPVDIVLDGVGGAQLVEAFGLLAPGGIVQSYGWISDEPAVFPPYSTVGAPRTLASFALPQTGITHLRTLLNLVAIGKLRVEIGWRGPWERYGEAIDELVGRRVNGKVVLDVT